MSKRYDNTSITVLQKEWSMLRGVTRRSHNQLSDEIVEVQTGNEAVGLLLAEDWLTLYSKLCSCTPMFIQCLLAKKWLFIPRKISNYQINNT